MEYKYIGQDLTPEMLHAMTDGERKVLCSELRHRILDVVSHNGGHLASNLGTVELTTALLSVFDYTKDKILFDVGHQYYSYKILTGRNDRFDTLRQKDGISGFPRISESQYDVFDMGHSSTSISAALGMARARDIKGTDEHVIAIIGDGAMTGGLALEAINDLGHSSTKMTVILNDNEMSIDRNVGGMSKYLKKLRISSGYLSAKKNTENFLNKIPLLGKFLVAVIMRIKKFFRFLVNKQQPSMFEDLGLLYYGPIDGHDTKGLISALDAVKDLEKPVLLHICTKKGKGYELAEQNPSDYHGVGPFNLEKGVVKSGSSSYTSAFGGAMLDIASKNKNVVGITAAMAQGTGLDKFGYKFPTRFFDVGIAEEHAVTMAAGLSRNGMIPVVAVYSSFLQRAYDQIIHDVCFMNNHVVFAVDRSGFVGADGHTHNGLTDISYFNSVQGMTILSPRDYTDLRNCMEYAVNEVQGPVAVRYPRGTSPFESEGSLYTDPSDVIRPHSVADNGDDFVIVSFGTICDEAQSATEKLCEKGIKGKHINCAIIKPMPVEELKAMFGNCTKIFTVEEGIRTGGAGQSLRELLGEDYHVYISAVDNQLIRAGSVKQQRQQAKIDSDSLCIFIQENV